MTGAAVVLAFTSALCFGVALVLTHIGLRYIPPLSGAAISIPSSTLLFVAIAPIVLGGRPIIWAAVPIYAAVGLFYPAAVTLLTFAANRALGPVITSALGNLAPLFAVGFAVLILGEPLFFAQIGGLLVTVAGVVIQFAADVDKATNGSLKITAHSAGSLIKHPEIKRSVRQGTAPIGEMLESLSSNEAAVYGLDSVPFLATGYGGC